MAEQKNKEGISIHLRREAFDRVCERLASLCDDFTDVGNAIADVLVDSVRRNFTEGGRPVQWPKSKRVREHGGQTLRDSDTLFNSLAAHFDPAGRRVTVGTNTPYAAPLHYGVNRQVEQDVRAHERTIAEAFGKKLNKPMQVHVREHKRTTFLYIPERPFMLMQADDWATVREIVEARIEEIIGGG